MAYISLSHAQTILYPEGGGTGIATSTSADDGNCLKQASSTPFLTYEFGTCGTGGGGGGLTSTTPWTANDLVQVVNDGAVRSIATSSLGLQNIIAFPLSVASTSLNALSPLSISTNNLSLTTSTGSGLGNNSGLQLQLGGNTTQACGGNDFVSSITATGTLICTTPVGGGGGSGLWATSTVEDGIYPTSNNYDVWIGDTASATAEFQFDTSAATLFVRGLVSSSDLFADAATTTGHLNVGTFDGANLSDCDTATSSKLLWDATNRTFSCGTDTDTDTDTDTQLSQEQVDDFVDALVNDADSVHTDITITYDDADNAMDFVVDTLPNLTGTLDIDSGGTGTTTGAVLWLLGTTNQVNVSSATGTVTLSAPQNIHSGASPTFSGLTLSGLTNCDTIDTDGSGVLSCGTDASGGGTDTDWTQSGGTLYATTTATDVGVGTTTPTGIFEVATSSTVGLRINDDGTVVLGTITTGVWNGTAIDFSDYTNATGGDGITFTDDSIAADLGTAIVSGEITDDTIQAVDLEATNAEADNDFITYDSATGGFTFNTASEVITAGTNISWSASTLNVDDAFVINSGSDTMTGTLTADGLTLGQDENITLGTKTLDHDGTSFVFNDDVVISSTGLTVNTTTISGLFYVATSTTHGLLVADSGRVGIGTSTTANSFLTIDDGIATTTHFSIGGSGNPACLRFRDSDDGAWTYVYYTDGSQTATTIKPGWCNNF